MLRLENVHLELLATLQESRNLFRTRYATSHGDDNIDATYVSRQKAHGDHERTVNQVNQETSSLHLELVTTMSYYFTIIGTRDNPLFELDFGTSKLGGDGIARFRDEAKSMNQFIVHAALDMVEEMQWGSKEL